MTYKYEIKINISKVQYVYKIELTQLSKNVMKHETTDFKKRIFFEGNNQAYLIPRNSNIEP